MSFFFEADQLDPDVAIAPDGSYRFVVTNLGQGRGSAPWDSTGTQLSAASNGGSSAKPVIATWHAGESRKFQVGGPEVDPAARATRSCADDSAF